MKKHDVSLDGKPLLYGKHCRGPGCDDFNEQQPSCGCTCDACTKPRFKRKRQRKTRVQRRIIQEQTNGEIIPCLRGQDGFVSVSEAVSWAGAGMHRMSGLLDVCRRNLDTTQRDLNNALTALRAVARARKACSRVMRIMSENGPRMLSDAILLATDTFGGIDPEAKKR